MTGASQGAKVISFPTGTVEERAALVRAYLAKQEPLLKVTSIRDALKYGDGWQSYAMRLETMLALATAQWESSETLLRLCEEECERLRGLLDQRTR